MVVNVSEWATVRRCTAVEDLASTASLDLITFKYTQPMKADDGIRDVVGATQVENQPRGWVED